MRIALLHGYRLSGSGSNEYTRYLARALARAGHQVHVLCREPDPQGIDFLNRAFAWSAEGECRPIFERPGSRPGECTLHQLPHGELRPVYVTDKQREGPVRPYTALTDAELEAHRDLYTRVVRAVLRRNPVDVVHANHVVLQPTVAADACEPLGIPFVIYPHGSAIEYTVREDPRYARLAREAITRASGLVIGSREVRERLCGLWPEARGEIEGKSVLVGVGVDTALFEPVSRDGRPASIGRLIDLHPAGGKPRALVEDLHARLARGDLDAVARYGDAYARARPDEDCAAHLGRIPWGTGSILLFVGALTVGKGLQRVVAGLPRLLRRVPDAHLVIVGSGAYREVLEALVHALATADEALLHRLVERGTDLVETHLTGGWPGVRRYLGEKADLELTLSAGRRFAEHVHFLGRLSHAYLRHLFPCADVAVFPSIIPEAYPLVLMESLANGVLPAASYFSGFAEGLDALVPEVGGATVDRLRLPLDPATAVAGIADKLASLLESGTSDDVRRRLRLKAEREYDWTVRAGQMVEAYDTLAGVTRPRRRR